MYSFLTSDISFYNYDTKLFCNRLFIIFCNKLIYFSRENIFYGNFTLIIFIKFLFYPV